jgi:hypothetical protein
MKRPFALRRALIRSRERCMHYCSETAITGTTGRSCEFRNVPAFAGALQTAIRGSTRIYIITTAMSDMVSFAPPLKMEKQP